jgi:hypothetical protein
MVRWSSAPSPNELENQQFGAHHRLMEERDRWTENFICRNCGNAGSARFSAPDELSWDVRLEGEPIGFKAVTVEHGTDFTCAACNCLVKP